MLQQSRPVPVRTIMAVIGLVLLTGVGVWLFVRLARIEAILVVAAFFAVVLNPLVELTQRRLHVRRGLAVAIVFLVVFGLLAALLYAFIAPLVDQGQKLADDYPRLVREAKAGKGPVGHLVKRYKLDEKLQENRVKINDRIGALGGGAFNVAKSVAAAVAALITIIVAALLMILYGPDMMASGLGLLSPPQRRRVQTVLRDCSRALTGYVFGNFLISIIAGAATFIALLDPARSLPRRTRALGRLRRPHPARRRHPRRGPCRARGVPALDDRRHRRARVLHRLPAVREPRAAGARSCPGPCRLNPLIVLVSVLVGRRALRPGRCAPRHPRGGRDPGHRARPVGRPAQAASRTSRPSGVDEVPISQTSDGVTAAGADELMPSEQVELAGHIVDSLILAKVLDLILEAGADYRMVEVDIGKTNTDPSRARLEIIAATTTLARRAARASSRCTGPTGSARADATLVPCDDRRRAARRLLLDDQPADPGAGRRPLARGARTRRWTARSSCRTTDVVRTVPMHRVHGRATRVVVGNDGVRVQPPERPRGASPFEFMASEVSSEKPKALLVARGGASAFGRKEAGGKRARGVRARGRPHRRRPRRRPARARRLDRRALRRQRLRHPRHRVERARHVARRVRARGPCRPSTGTRNHLRVINEVRRRGSIAGRGRRPASSPAA